MKKLILAFVAAAGVMSVANQQASAWCNFNFGAGFNVGFQCGRDKFSTFPGSMPGPGNCRQPHCAQPCQQAPQGCEQAVPFMSPANLELVPSTQAQTPVIEFVPQFAQPSMQTNMTRPQATQPSFPSYVPQTQNAQPNAQPNGIHYVPVYIQQSNPTPAQPVRQSSYAYSDSSNNSGIVPAYWADR